MDGLSVCGYNFAIISSAMRFRENTLAQVNSYRDLIVWQKGMELAKGMYAITRQFPGDEKFGLTTQLRRASVSVPSNIAEGYGRNSTNDYVRFLRMAVGSVFEIHTQLEIALAEEFLARDDYDALSGLSTRLERCLFV